MALTATLNLDVTPNVLTVVSDKRKVEVTVSAVGETVVAKGTFPVKITDSRGIVWNVKSDDGSTAVYNPA